MIAIIDTGAANISSVVFAMNRLGQEAVVSRDPKIFRNASHVILPGVGHANPTMQRLEAIKAEILSLSQPVLGICLGMQLLFDSTEEGPTMGLGVIKGKVLKMNSSEPIPHMGWNSLSFQSHPLFNDIDSRYFYFTHSFASEVNQNTIATFEYGKRYSGVVMKENFIGVQFHPEKSSRSGLTLLRNFLCL